jgi:CBS domain-containing protein
MPRNTLVRDVMTTDVVAFHPDDSVEDAVSTMAARGIGGAPVVDADGRLVGMLADDDLIVQDTRLHVPTVISVLGAYLELPSQVSRFEDELRKAVASSVGDLMTREPPTCTEDETVEDAATRMHERDVSRLPVLRDGHLVGIVSRGDILRDIVRPGR